MCLDHQLACVAVVSVMGQVPEIRGLRQVICLEILRLLQLQELLA